MAKINNIENEVLNYTITELTLLSIDFYFLLRNFELNIDEMLSLLKSNEYADIGRFLDSWMNLSCIDELHRNQRGVKNG